MVNFGEMKAYMFNHEIHTELGPGLNELFTVVYVVFK